MLLKAVVDIDPSDPRFQELGEMAFGLGLFDMTEILMVFYARLYSADQADPKGLVASAVINLANWKYQSIEIELPTGTRDRIKMQIERIYPAETHKGLGETYLSKAREEIARKPAS